MGMKYKNVGGSGTGLGGDFATFLQQGLMGGKFGTGEGAQGGIGGLLNDILGGGAGNIGGALKSILQTQQTNDVNSIRSRYGVGGGTGFGTPAAYGEATYRAQAAPQITSAIGNLQLGALGQILPSLTGIAGKDIPQAGVVGQQSPWAQAAGIALPLIGSAIGAGIGGAPGASIGGNIGSSVGQGLNTQPQTFSFNANTSIPNPFYH